MASSADHPNNCHESPTDDETILVYEWAQFDAAFPTDADARQKLHGTSESFNSGCKRCRAVPLLIVSAGKVVYCPSCRKSSWLTANTFFHNIRRPRAWLWAIWLMERGIIPSLLQFCKLAGVAYSTAWNIFRKLSIVAEGRMLNNFAEVPSSAFSIAVSRRSLETPAHAHPTAEIQEIEKVQPNRDSSGAHLGAEISPESAPADDFDTDLAEREKQVRDLLASTPTHFDELIERSGLSTSQLSAALTMLEFSGIATCMPGDWYARRTALKARPVRSMSPHSHLSAAGQSLVNAIESALAFFRTTFHGVSRKYLQLFLALNWCRTDRTSWPLGALLAACHQSDPITEADVLAYVSPRLIKTSVGPNYQMQ